MAGEMNATRLRAGAAKIDITPPMGVEMCGYGPYLKRTCTEVLDPLYAHALWLETPESRVLLISVDLCALARDARDAAAREIAERCGIDPGSMLICSSHTHSGPAAQRLIGWGEVDARYMRMLHEKLVACAVRAQGAAEPALLGAVRQRMHDIGVNREQTSVAPLDTAAQLLRVDRLNGSTLAIVYNFGAHGVVRYPQTARISADWPGLVGAALQWAFPGAVPLFLQGACGDINAHDMLFDQDDLEIAQKVCDMRVGDVAYRFAEQITPALRNIEMRGDTELHALWKEIELPCAPPSREILENELATHLPLADSRQYADLPPLHARLPHDDGDTLAWCNARFVVDSVRHQLCLLEQNVLTVPAPLQVLRIGRMLLVGWPGEIFIDFSLEVRQRSPAPLTAIATFSNADIGYIPTPAAFASQQSANQFGIYPVQMTPRIYGWLPFRPDVGRVLVEETMALLRAVC